MLPLFARGGAVDPPVILVIALIADMAFGDPALLWSRVPHPVAAIGGVIAWLDLHLNRPQRGARDRLVRGALATVGLALVAVAAGVELTMLRRQWAFGWIVETIAVWTLLAQRSLFDHVRAVARALDREGLDAGRTAVAAIVGRDPDSLDRHGVARAAIESCAENFADGVVAPVFWYLLFGAPGLLACKTVNTLDGMIGHRDARHLQFGRVAARLDDAMNFLPARLAGFLLSAAALFTPRGRPLAALRVMWSEHGHHASPNSGWPEAAMAGALDLALAGPRRYTGVAVVEKWIGEGGRALATTDDIRRALYLFAIACLLDFGLVVAVAALQG